MSQVIIYDVNGESHTAKIVDGVPEIHAEWFEFEFSFLVRIINSDNDIAWWVNGKRHRLDGPAIEWANGGKSWWINGNFYSEKEWKKQLKELA